MNWPVALVFAYVLVGMETVLPQALGLGPGGATPSFVLPLVVFIAMYAPPSRAYWSALLLGLSLDLLTPWNGSVTVPGPRALGFLAAAYLVITIRSIINRNLLGLVVFSVLGSALSQVVVVTLLTFRSFYSAPANWHPRAELVQRVMGSVYTGASAAVVGLALLACVNAFRFQDPYASRRGGVGRDSVVRMRRP